jgi:predicted RNase H-like nuclease (RuvC/YqgF family)
MTPTDARPLTAEEPLSKETLDVVRRKLARREYKDPVTIAVLLGDVDALTRENQELQAQVEASEAEVERLRRALKLFANAYEWFCEFGTPFSDKVSTDDFKNAHLASKALST